MDEEAFQLKLPEKFTPAEQLKRLWEIPEKVPGDFRIPEGACLALASGSEFKRKGVTEVWNGLGGKGIILTRSRNEEDIKSDLQKVHRSRTRLEGGDGVVDTYRTLNIAEQKALLTDDMLLKSHGVTHVMGMDIDVTPWPNEEPLGTPQDIHDLIHNLEQMSGKNVMVSIGCAVRPVGSRSTASEQVHVTLPIQELDVQKYLKDHKNGDGLVDRIAGGIDFSDPTSFQYIGDGPVIVDRMFRHSPNFNPLTQLERTVIVNGPRKMELLGEMGDYFKGAPKDMVKWVLYDGLRSDKITT